MPVPETGARWQVTGDRWHVTGDRWQVTGDRWKVTGDSWQLTPLLLNLLDLFVLVYSPDTSKDLLSLICGIFWSLSFPRPKRSVLAGPSCFEGQKQRDRAGIRPFYPGIPRVPSISSLSKKIPLPALLSVVCGTRWLTFHFCKRIQLSWICIYFEFPNKITLRLTQIS